MKDFSNFRGAKRNNAGQWIVTEVKTRLYITEAIKRAAAALNKQLVAVGENHIDLIMDEWYSNICTKHDVYLSELATLRTDLEAIGVNTEAWLTE